MIVKLERKKTAAKIEVTIMLDFYPKGHAYIVIRLVVER